MASAELAAALPALVLVLAVGVAAVQVGIDEVRCVDAARVAARVLARGESEDQARAAAARAGPTGASVLVVHQGTEVTVEVSAVRSLAGWSALSVSGRATGLVEDGGAG